MFKNADGTTPMNIYALKGHIVKLTSESIKNGNEHDSELIEKFLKLGRGYQVDFTNVANTKTNVYLIGYPHIAFNSVNFADVKPQLESDDMLHLDYKRYNP